MTKSINLVSSVIQIVSIEDIDGVVTVTVIGRGLDGGVNEYPTLNLVMDWSDLPVQVQNSGNNFIKHLSREFNKLTSDEDSDTWVNP